MKFTFEEHCTENALELYALNRLDDARIEKLEEHVLICEDCRVRLDEADHFVQAMRRAATAIRLEAKSPTKRSWFATDWLRMPTPTWAAAAVAVFAVALISVTQIHHGATDGHRASVTLLAERGAAISAPAGKTLDLKLDARGLDLGPRAVIELADARGKIIERSIAPQIGDIVEMHPDTTLAQGGYFLRLYGETSTDPQREFALDVK